MERPHADTLGLIAGQGRLPLEVARAARRAGRRVVAVGFRGFACEALADEVDALEWVHVGELGRLLDALRALEVGEAALVGGVAKRQMFESGGLLRIDARARELLAQLTERGDDAILRAVGTALEAEGIALRPQTELAPGLLAPEGPLGAVAPTPEQADDVRFGWSVAKAIGELDVGQTVVVRGRTVLAVEAIEGTDAAIRRGAELGGPGVCVVKVFKPRQDARFDLPTIGAATADVLRAAGAALLAVEAGRSFVLDRETLVREADRSGICLLGVAPDGPPPAPGAAR
ncbi:MAG: UDP-2,3-diacylglucosamine diphosphatase LpxI [Myxococcota bacterium]|nr:UDP-2,3-diacylglucosamine diphosphatase LpxI [Myxococcota bacterium]